MTPPILIEDAELFLRWAVAARLPRAAAYWSGYRDALIAANGIEFSRTAPAPIGAAIATAETVIGERVL